MSSKGSLGPSSIHDILDEAYALIDTASAVEGSSTQLAPLHEYYQQCRHTCSIAALFSKEEIELRDTIRDAAQQQVQYETSNDAATPPPSVPTTPKPAKPNATINISNSNNNYFNNDAVAATPNVSGSPALPAASSAQSPTTNGDQKQQVPFSKSADNNTSSTTTQLTLHQKLAAAIKPLKVVEQAAAAQAAASNSATNNNSNSKKRRSIGYVVHIC